jgi:hypothetical protein
MTKRQYFKRAVEAKRQAEIRALKGRVAVKTPDGQSRVVQASFVKQQLGRINGALKLQRTGKSGNFTSETARAAINARWAKHVMTRFGFRKGARFVRRAPVKRAPLRARYAMNPTRGVQYVPNLRVWTVTDDHGTRPITERTALIRLGHLPRRNDAIIPVEITAQLGTSSAKKGRTK